MKIVINSGAAMPPGQLATAEVHFTEGPFEGLKLIGFGIWERARMPGGKAVTFPSRQYQVNGDRRSFEVLRPIGIDGFEAQNRARDLILEAYDEYVKTLDIK